MKTIEGIAQMLSLALIAGALVGTFAGSALSVFQWVTQ
jgi:flagellar motor component MotA